MKLYELVGKDKTQGFSPYVWRSKMALAHKGITPELVPLTFNEISNLEGVESKTVPIIEHDGTYISDSWDIACYLEDNFPDKPPLFKGEQGRAHVMLMNNVIFYTLLVPLFKALVSDIYEIIDDQDREYFRASREPRIGQTLEEAAADQDKAVAAVIKQLWPYNTTLKTQNFFDGDSPAYIDYMIYGLFQWSRGVSTVQIVADDSPLFAWRARMDDLFDGLGKVITPRS